MSGRGVLYMLLAPDVYDPIDRKGLKERFGWLVPKAFGLINRQMRVVDVVRAIDDVEGSRLIPGDWLPQMLTFDNDDIPMSVRPVDPQNMDAAFGAGVRFVGARLAITK